MPYARRPVLARYCQCDRPRARRRAGIRRSEWGGAGVGTPLDVFTGVWFALFGLGVLWWCACEVRVRRALRRGGSSAVARVLADPDAAADHADPAPVLSFQAEGHGEIVTRPRGWTTVRRVPALPVGVLVPVVYDPAAPRRVVVEGVAQASGDVLWALLGLLFTGAGIVLLAQVF